MPVRRIETINIIVGTCFGIVVLRGEAIAEEVGKGAGLGDRAPEVIVLVGGDDVAGLVNVLRDVAVVVECREVELAVARHGKEAAHATRALERA